MRALVFEKPRTISLEEVPEPKMGPRDVLIRVKACGVCGTDLHLFAGDVSGLKYPMTPGHEFAGVIEATGSEAIRFRVGDRVTAEPNLSCGNCYYCHRNQQNFCENWAAIGWPLPGGMAEFVVVPETNLFLLPPELSFAEGAFAEPLACVAYGLERARPALGSSVLIYGVGPIGLQHLQAVRHGGAGVITVVGRRPERLELAKVLGANHVVVAGPDGPDKALRQISPRGFDLVIDCTGIPDVVEQSVQHVKNCGKLLIFGVSPESSKISISPFEIFRRDLEIIGSFALRKNIDQALQLLVSRAVRVEPLLSDRLSLEEIPAGLERMMRGQVLGKVQLTID